MLEAMFALCSLALHRCMPEQQAVLRVCARKQWTLLTTNTGSGLSKHQFHRFELRQFDQAFGPLERFRGQLRKGRHEEVHESQAH